MVKMYIVFFSIYQWNKNTPIWRWKSLNSLNGISYSVRNFNAIKVNSSIIRMDYTCNNSQCNSLKINSIIRCFKDDHKAEAKTMLDLVFKLSIYMIRLKTKRLDSSIRKLNKDTQGNVFGPSNFHTLL